MGRGLPDPFVIVSVVLTALVSDGVPLGIRAQIFISNPRVSMEVRFDFLPGRSLESVGDNESPGSVFLTVLLNNPVHGQIRHLSFLLPIPGGFSLPSSSGKLSGCQPASAGWSLF
jgi:hypothetical protein